MRKCILIGGGGFIGSHLAKSLELDRSREIIIIGRSAKPKFSIPETSSYITLDSLSEDKLKGILCDAEEIVDLSSSHTPGGSIEMPLDVMSDTLKSNLRFINLINSNKLEKYIFISSGGTIYGNTKDKLTSEISETNPISPYGVAKLLVEKFGHLNYALKNLPFISVRPSNPFGVGQRGNLGQGFIAAAIHMAIHKSPVPIYGSPGTIRDYIYIDDLVGGIIAVLNLGHVGKTYNIGTGNGVNNMDILSIIEDEISSLRPIQIKPLPIRNFDVASNVLDCSLIHKDTGWQPKISLRSGILKTWAWQMKLAELNK